MGQQHNPIANLLEKIQQHWRKEISSDANCRLVRWLIQPGEVKLYQGFLQLESSVHGSLPEMIVAQLTPFQSADTFSAAIATTWIEAYERDTTFRTSRKIPGFTKTLNSDDFLLQPIKRDKELIDLLTAFRNEHLEDRTLVLALLPQTISSTRAYEQWMHLLEKTGIPAGLTLVAFVPEANRLSGSTFPNASTALKTVSLRLDLERSISKIATAGNPLDAEVHLRQAIYKMSGAVQRHSITELKTAGAGCISYQLRLGNMALIATAHIIYAGMLFNFKLYEEIESTLTKGSRFALRGLSLGDQSCKPLMVQFYAYLAACQNLNNKKEQAILNYQQGAMLASTCGMHLQALGAWQQAATLAAQSNRKLHLELLHEAFNAGKVVPIEELRHSEFQFIGFALYHRLQEQNNNDVAEQISDRMTQIYGPDWEERTRRKVGAAKSKKTHAEANLINAIHLP